MTKTSASISRRTFVSQTLLGMGALSLNSIAAPFKSSKPETVKKLFATTDYTDNLFGESFMDLEQLDQFHECLASLGVTRHQWIVDTIWTIYENYPHNFDLLAEVVKSAHKHGIELYGEIKTFEDGGFGALLPLTMPFPKGAVALKNMKGIDLLARPFAARHPEMSMKRRPGSGEFKLPVKAIRIVKRDDSHTRLKAEHLSIWTSATNNRFTEYTGPVSFRESVEWRKGFPKWKQSRILNFEGLEIPNDHRYILIRSSMADSKGDFTNEKGKILEIIGADGKVIPYGLSRGPADLDYYTRVFFKNKMRTQLIRYLQLPEVQKEISDPEKMKWHFQDFYPFDEFYKVTKPLTLDREGFIAAACGRPEYMLGNLNPIYPEVREHWMELVHFCLDRGVDGINFRMANHTRSPEYWEYGYNEPVLKATGGKTDYTSINKVNGDAYTKFLRDAKTVIKARGKGLTLHLHAGMLFPDDRQNSKNSLPSLPPNIEWQWQTWVHEIADDLEFRGSFKLQPWNLQMALDIFSAVTHAANKPFYFQSDFHSYPTDEGRKQLKLEEIELVKNYPRIDGFVLYETANFTYKDENNRIALKPNFMGEIIKEHYQKK